MVYFENMEAITIVCPNCGWRPESKLFFNLSLSVYQNNNKLHKIRCQYLVCNFEGDFTEWLSFTANK